MAKVLMVKNYRGYDTYAIPLECAENTWGEVKGYLESILDDQFCKLNTIVGCKVSAEIVEMSQEEIDGHEVDD